MHTYITLYIAVAHESNKHPYRSLPGFIECHSCKDNSNTPSMHFLKIESSREIPFSIKIKLSWFYRRLCLWG